MNWADYNDGYKTGALDRNILDAPLVVALTDPNGSRAQGYHDGYYGVERMRRPTPTTQAPCPHCGQTLSHLSYTATVEEYGDVTLFGNCDIRFHTKGSDTTKSAYSCPYCNKQVAETQDDVVTLLTPREEP